MSARLTRYAARPVVLLALLALAVLGLVQPATAQAATTGSITIVDEHNGTAGTVAIPGAVFVVSRVVGLDPTTDAGAALFKQYQASLATTQPPTTDARTLDPTDSSGRSYVGNLPIGAYLIHEEGVLDGNGQMTAAAYPVADFLVATPTCGDNGDPIYDLQIMPKTTIDAPAPTQSTTATPTPATSATTARSSAPTPSSAATTGWSSAPIPTSTYGGGQQPVPGATGTAVVPQYQPQAQITSPTQSQPTGTHINSGDGANFNSASQWATIVFAAALVSVVFLLTGRRRRAGEK